MKMHIKTNIGVEGFRFEVILPCLKVGWGELEHVFGAAADY